MLHLPGGAGETGRWCARRPSPAAGSHLSRGAPALTFIAPQGFVREALRLARVSDSLVRVTRRVGWDTDVAADPWRP